MAVDKWSLVSKTRSPSARSCHRRADLHKNMSFLGRKSVFSDIDWGQGVSTSDNFNAISVSLKIISWKFRKHTYFLGHIDPSGGRTSNWIIRVFWNDYDARLHNDWIWHRICEKIDYCDLRHRSWVKSSKTLSSSLYTDVRHYLGFRAVQPKLGEHLDEKWQTLWEIHLFYKNRKKNENVSRARGETAERSARAGLFSFFLPQTNCYFSMLKNVFF